MNTIKQLLLFTAFCVFVQSFAFGKDVKKANWTFMVYIAGDNDLFEFVQRDLKEMAKVGSNEHVSIVAQIDEYGRNYPTKRVFIEKGKITVIKEDGFDSKLDSGNPETLVDFCKWAIDNYPANHYALDLWNHGEGIIDPALYGEFGTKGICFNDTYDTYLTNQDLDYALEKVTQHLGRKLDILACDACLMAMLEFASYVRHYAHYLVASQELEPGDGWHYKEVLKDLADHCMTPLEFSQHIVESFRVGYLSKVNDFTQSAIDLRKVRLLLYNLHKISNIILLAQAYELDDSVTLAINTSRSWWNCTSFDEPSYIDLLHFYRNLRVTAPFIKLKKERSNIVDQLVRELDTGIKLFESIVVANVSGSKKPYAGGLSIYFPERYIDDSYKKLYFAKNNAWMKLLKKFV